MENKAQNELEALTAIAKASESAQRAESLPANPPTYNERRDLLRAMIQSVANIVVITNSHIEWQAAKPIINLACRELEQQLKALEFELLSSTDEKGL